MALATSSRCQWFTRVHNGCPAAFQRRRVRFAHCFALNVEHFSAISFASAMRSMTGYGRAEVVHAGRKFSVELNSVNRKQSDIVINLPRDLGELEPRIRQTINENISRGRTNAMIALHSGPNGTRTLALDTELARSYHEAMRALQKELNAPGEITISTILQAPGVMRFPEQALDAGGSMAGHRPCITRRPRRFNQNARTRRANIWPRT